LGTERTELAESLDLTRVQYNDEMVSKFEDEKSLLMTEFTDKLKARAVQLVDLMCELGVEIDEEDTGAETAEDFSRLI